MGLIFVDRGMRADLFYVWMEGKCIYGFQRSIMIVRQQAKPEIGLI